MRTIEVDDQTHAQLAVAASLTGQSIREVLTRLVQRMADMPVFETESPLAARQDDEVREGIGQVDVPSLEPLNGGWLPIYRVFKGKKVEGLFNPRTLETRITSQPWGNRIFSSPTGAAVAVVERYAGEDRKSPSTNGRKFWRLASNDRDLRSVVGTR